MKVHYAFVVRTKGVSSIFVSDLILILKDVVLYVPVVNNPEKRLTNESTLDLSISKGPLEDVRSLIVIKTAGSVEKVNSTKVVN